MEIKIQSKMFDASQDQISRTIQGLMVNPWIMVELPMEQDGPDTLDFNIRAGTGVTSQAEMLMILDAVVHTLRLKMIRDGLDPDHEMDAAANGNRSNTVVGK